MLIPRDSDVTMERRGLAIQDKTAGRGHDADSSRTGAARSVALASVTAAATASRRGQRQQRPLQVLSTRAARAAHGCLP